MKKSLLACSLFVSMLFLSMSAMGAILVVEDGYMDTEPLLTMIMIQNDKELFAQDSAELLNDKAQEYQRAIDDPVITGAHLIPGILVADSNRQWIQFKTSIACTSRRHRHWFIDH